MRALALTLLLILFVVSIAAAVVTGHGSMLVLAGLAAAGCVVVGEIEA